MTQISVVSVPVADQDRAKQFYVDVLGFDLVADNSFGDEMRWIQVMPPGGGASLTLVTWFEEMAAGSLRGLVIDTDDIQQTCAELASRGLADVGTPQQLPGGTFLMVRDPDGNIISFHQR